MTSFNDLGLSAPLLRALAAKNYDTPTPIQLQAIPPLLEGRDLCGIAQTGTGKTAAFALPSIQKLTEQAQPRRPRSCRMLVLSPTRELAAQIAQSCKDYGKFGKLVVETVFGGVPINRQIAKLSTGVDILVATPGRLLDLIDQRALTLGDVSIFVLDEADQMMDMGFIHSLRRVAKLLPARRQNLFFSATMPTEIANLSRQFLHDPVTVSVAPQATTAERVAQRMIFVDQREKQALLHATVRSEAIDRALIFTRTKHGADRVVKHLAAAGIQAAAIHGNKSQGQRTQALEAFRRGDIRLLVATDIAARGIDVSGVSHVINFEIPNVPEQYVHRIGRTARAGAEGIAISFVADDERPYIKAIEKVTRMRPEAMPLPEGFAALVRAMPKPPADRPERHPLARGGRNDGQQRRGQGLGHGQGTGQGQGQRKDGSRGEPSRGRGGADAGRQRAPQRDGADGAAPRTVANPTRRRPGVGGYRGAVRPVTG